MRGLSGAVVDDNNNGLTVTKHGGIPERTREQGEWILQHSSRDSVFPNVYALLDDGYVMEKLEFIDYWEIDPFEMVELLRTHVWSQGPVVAPTAQTKTLLVEKMDRTLTKILSGVVSNDTKIKILNDAEKAASGAFQLQHALTHGDPTAENVMQRPGFGKVLIDPIRASETVPDSPAVDIGKMLQSACGWENAKYGTGPSSFSRESLRLAVADDDLFEVGEAWATVHVMRAVPYVMRSMPHIMPSVIAVLETAIERK